MFLVPTRARAPDSKRRDWHLIPKGAKVGVQVEPLTVRFRNLIRTEHTNFDSERVTSASYEGECECTSIPSRSEEWR